MSEFEMNGVGSIEYRNRQIVEDEWLAEWESQTPDDRANDLYDSLANDVREDVGSGHDVTNHILNSMKFADTQGNLFSVRELSVMSTSELILRGILKPRERPC